MKLRLFCWQFQSNENITNKKKNIRSVLVDLNIMETWLFMMIQHFFIAHSERLKPQEIATKRKISFDV